MEFVNNLNNLTVDDQYFMEIPVSQGTNTVPAGNIGLIGTFSRGPLNTPTLVTSYPDLVKRFGEVDSSFLLTGTACARQIFKQGNTNLYVVRISSAASPAATASTIIKDVSLNTVMTLSAFTPGTWGNSLTVTVATGTKAGTFKVSLQYGSESETWDNLVIAQPATPIVGAQLASVVFGGLSNLATASFPSTPNLNTPSAATQTMTGGVDGGTGTVSSDYVGGNTNGTKTGMSALDSAPINYILAAEQSDPTTNTALMNNAINVTQAGGLPRKAIITFPRNTYPSGLSTLVTAFDSDRVFAAYGYQQVYDPVTGVNQYVSPLGFFAGVMAQLSPQQSPGNKPVYGTLGVDPTLNLGAADLSTIAQAQVNVVGVQTPAGPLGVRGGWTMSKTAGDSQQIYVRNMKDYIDESVFTIGGQFVDQPITTTLMRQVYQSVDNLLLPMKVPAAVTDQMIADYRITCDPTNNPPASIAQNRLVCDYAVKLLNMDRFMVFRTQIGAGVVIKSGQQ